MGQRTEEEADFLREYGPAGLELAEFLRHAVVCRGLWCRGRTSWQRLVDLCRRTAGAREIWARIAPPELPFPG